MKLKVTKLSTIKLLYQMFYDFHNIMLNHGIKYFICSGTLLGAVRHKGIIPWDDDIDVGMLSKDIRQLLDLTIDFKKCGYSIVKTWFGYKLFYTKRKKDYGYDYSFPSLDIFPWRKFDDGTYKFSIKQARDTWPKETIKQKDLYPLVEYEFGSFNVLGPSNHKNYFNYYFGSDWNDIAYREYDHEKEEEVEVVKVNVTPSMRKPAKP